MTPLQALEMLAQFIIEKDDNTDFSASVIEAHNEIKKALTPPTADEVVNAIQDEIEWETEFRDNGFYFKDTADYIAKLDDEGRLLYGLHPTPKTSSLISRFYEAQEW